MEAAWKPHPQMVKLLLDKGVDVKAKTVSGWPPLHSAVAGGRPEVISLFVDKGADINAKTKSGETPIQTARVDNRHKIEKLLRTYGGMEQATKLAMEIDP